MTKEKLRKAIARQTAEYIERGGVIEIIPKRWFVPHWHRWMIKWGFDYHPWNLVGFPSVAGRSDKIGPGCYVTLPLETEG